MNKPNIKTTKQVIPMIYAYSTPDIPKYSGWLKIGYTERDVEKRVNEQASQIIIDKIIEWQGNAIFDDGSGDIFSDTDFHRYLVKNKIERESRSEWFKTDKQTSRTHFYNFRANRGITKTLDEVVPYKLRDEQEEAVNQTIDYFNQNSDDEFLWNAKPRFGKTLSVYDLIQKLNFSNVLIVTNRPAIANSWFDDYAKFLGTKSGYLFVSSVDSLKNRAGVLSRDEYIKKLDEKTYKSINFVSLQDLKGSLHFGGEFDKLEYIAELEWDILVIDEAHEAVDTYKTEVAFDRIKRKFTLHLSGTPFKALSSGKFDSDAIYNWTYADEQSKKESWSGEDENPYINLPKLNMFTYQMSKMIEDELKQGIEIDGEVEEYAFDLNEFFSTKKNGSFKYDNSVDKFLDALTNGEKYPFSTKELRDELNHTFWLLDRVDSAKALAKKLKNHPIFKEYEIVLAAGDGKFDDSDENEKSYDKVKEAIKEHEKTITLSVGQLTTGVTIPEWTAVLMLSNVKSPSLYMQAAFRAQNPCLFRNKTEYKRKENAYVFDFDPARTLIIYEEFANNLSPNTAGGGGSSSEREKNIKELLNFFPVIGEDEDGKLIELDPAKVLSIPRKIKSIEVVKRGFMSNFLFQNISGIFAVPLVASDILQKIEPVSQPKGVTKNLENAKEELNLNENGEVELSNEFIIGKSTEIFGNKIYTDKMEINEDISEILEDNQKDKISIIEKTLSKHLNAIKENIIKDSQNSYNKSVTNKDEREIELNIDRKIDEISKKTAVKFEIEQKTIKNERDNELKNKFTTNKSTEEIEEKYNQKLQESKDKFKEEIVNIFDDFIDEAKTQTIQTIEKNIKTRIKEDIEESNRAHLRGFSRTIPSFLMAYGDDNVTLANFDKIIPADVFKEVTSITIDEFLFLRDGGPYIAEDESLKKFEGKLFDEVVFNDSVKEFLALKKKLSNYFDEESKEDIFDYIPPQQTNQIFTPKKVVKDMVDLLEQENSGCFDEPSKTFIDLYMKSGLYIAQIVKRLYNSDGLKKEFPDRDDRLKHIFENQVFGLAPTEIIYKISTNFILGFDESLDIKKHNFKLLDALPLAKEGNLKEKLDEIYG